MQYVLDAALVAVFIFSIVRAAKKGFFEALFDLGVYVISMISAKVLSVSFAPKVYSSYIEASAREYLTKSLGSTAQADFSSKVQTVINSIPDSLDGVMKMIGIDSGAIAAQVSEADLSGKHAVDVAMQKIVSPVCDAVIQTVLFIAISLLMMALLKIVVRLFGSVIKKLPAIKQVNSSLGAVLGAVKGALLVVLLSVLMGVVASVSKSEQFIVGVNDSVIINSIRGFLTSISGSTF